MVYVNAEAAYVRTDGWSGITSVLTQTCPTTRAFGVLPVPPSSTDLCVQQSCEPLPLAMCPTSLPLAASCQTFPRLSSTYYLADDIVAKAQDIIVSTGGLTESCRKVS